MKNFADVVASNTKTKVNMNTVVGQSQVCKHLNGSISSIIEASEQVRTVASMVTQQRKRKKKKNQRRTLRARAYMSRERVFPQELML